jgi:hypothetical protein
VSDAYALVRRAIEERRPIEATYAGHHRSLCPHVLGTKDGTRRALFFQFAGGSSRGLPPDGDWRCLDIGGLSNLTIVDGPWRTKPHTQPQSCVDKIDLAVKD